MPVCSNPGQIHTHAIVPMIHLSHVVTQIDVFTSFFRTSLLALIEQSVGCVCWCGRTTTFELHDL